VKGEPQNGIFRFHLAASLMAAGSKEKAREEMRQALKLDANLRKDAEAQKLAASLSL
jgi:Flp pilus assembly protein TadD